MGGKTQTTTQQSSSTPNGLPQLYDIWGRVKDVASQPYTPYGGQMVAGLTPTQQAGIAGVSGAQGSAQPYFDQAADYARTGAAPIDASSINRYMSPYTQNVIDATRRNFDQDNAIQQNQIVGNAAAKGALGGDRVGVAQAEAARQQRLAQDPVIAGLYSSAYDKAIGAAQQDRSAAAQGAYTFGALAPSVQNARISGAQAQIGAGGLEQGTEQAKLTAAYNQYLQRLAFPYQQAGFLASAGLPAVGAMGGQTAGASTQPGPNPWGQIAGLGLTAAMMLRHGGRVPPRYASGGPIGLFDIPTYVPKFSGASAMSPYASAPALPTAGKPQEMQGFSPQQIMGASKGLKSLFGGGDTTPTGFTGNTDVPFSGIPDAMTSFQGGIPYPVFRRGGRVDPMERFHRTYHSIRRMMDGGPVIETQRDPNGIYIPRGYADGGDISPNDYVRAGFGDAGDAVASGAFDPVGANAMGPMAFSPPTAPSTPMPMPRPDSAPQGPYALPPAMTAQDGDALPADAMAFDAPRSPFTRNAPMATGAPDSSAAAPAKPASGLFGNPLNLSDDARMALMSAGLGMMASKSPFALSAIGEGGQQGVKTYQERVNQRQKVDSEAKRLAQQAEQFAQTIGLNREKFTEDKRQAGVTEEQALVPKGYRKTKEGGLEAIPGGPADPETVKANAEAKIAEGGLLDPETTKFMAQQYRAGDTSVLTNLGRGQQGAQNIIRVRQEIQRQNAAEGLGGADQAVRNAEFFGTKAGQRTLGTKQANIELAATEFKQVLPVVQEASKAVSRTNFPDLNRVIQMAQEKTGSPEIVAFGGGINTLINLYARAISPSGVPTVSDKDHAREILNKAWSQGQFDAAVGMMGKEIDAALTSPEKVRDEMRKRFIGGQKGPASAAPEAGAPKPGDRKQFKQGWGVWDGTQYVPEKP